MKERFFLGLDFETQDDKAETTRITEVGCTLVEVFDGGSKKVDGLSAFCWEPDYPKQTDFIVDLTGITDDMLIASGRPRKWVFENQLLPLIEKADVIFAHKTSFDRTIFECTCKLLGIEIPRKEWICTLSEFPWPKKLTCHKLSHLAYEHGILKDPRTLHRAENDTDLMMELVFGHYPIEMVLEYARAPWIYLKGDVQKPWKDGGVQNAIAKQVGFSWQVPKGASFPTVPESWIYRTKSAADVDRVQEAVRTSKSPFRISVIEGLA